MIASAIQCAHGSTGCNLPHTGLDLVWIIPVAVLLIIAGIALRRAGRA